MNTILLRKYPVKLFKYWLVGYTVGVLLAVAFVSLKERYFWYHPDNTDEFNPTRYMRDNWIPNSDVELTYVSQWPFNIRGIEYLMHVEKGENRSVADALAKRIRVFCIVMTSPKHQKNRSQVIKNTWGQRCEGIIFMSTVAVINYRTTKTSQGLSVSDPSLPAVALKPNKDDPRGKFKETLQYVYHHHADEADWFIKAEDDTYIIMENLKYMLNNYSSEEASYFGYMSDGDKDEELLSKAGYVLSKAALKAVVDWSSQLCNSSLRKDYRLIECLRKLKIKIVDTHDSAGHARFFPYNPPKLQQSSTGASDFPVSFHKINDNFLYVMEFFVYHLRAYGIVANYAAPEPYHPPVKESGISDIKGKV